ncbi:MAG: hypothetical protein JXA42_01540 [Anaerolineales bacterium]|nr:hypothetical protein [Anaerolineales bacterium]
MHTDIRLPWEDIHDFLLDVGRERDPNGFCVQIVEKIYPLIPYDKARIYFVGDNDKICGEALFGVEKYWSDAYLEYYSGIENGRYEISSKSDALLHSQKRGHHPFPDLVGSVTDWTQVEPDEFVSGYIRPQGLRYSTGVWLHSADDSMKSVYMLDRTSRSGFTPREIEMLRRIHPHLENLHKNLTVREPNRVRHSRAQASKEHLTEREAEIAELLCKGLTPNAISSKLCLSLSTVYRHIANMHKKLDVSNRQELLLALMTP